MNGHLTLESLSFYVPAGELQALPQPKQKNVESAEEQRERILLSIKSFNDDQEAVFNAVVGQILFGVTADDPFAAVCPKKPVYARKSHSFFLDAAGGTGKTFVMRTIQSLLQFRGQKVISVAISAVAVSLLENRRTAHSVFKIPIPRDAEIVSLHH